MTPLGKDGELSVSVQERRPIHTIELSRAAILRESPSSQGSRQDSPAVQSCIAQCQHTNLCHQRPGSTETSRREPIADWTRWVQITPSPFSRIDSGQVPGARSTARRAGIVARIQDTECKIFAGLGVHGRAAPRDFGRLQNITRCASRLVYEVAPDVDRPDAMGRRP